jgi:Ni,Fe-hydrogenase I cytochrome b subunit
LILAAVLLFSLVTVESGGFFLRRVVQGDIPVNDLQRGFFRAGHAHAGVLLVLSLIIPVYLDAANATGIVAAIARYATPVAAVLLPAGFFLSVIGRSPERPNRFVVLLPVGGVVLAIGLVTTGILLIAGVH